MAYPFLSDDLSELNDAFESCPLRTARQRETYRRPPKGKTITHELYGRETSGERPVLRLFAEDGYDGEPVGSLSAKSARAFWYAGSDHQFPPTRDLVRAGFFFHLPLLQTALLALKGEWERHLADERGFRTGLGMTLPEAFADPASDAEVRRFHPPFEELHAAIVGLAGGVREAARSSPDAVLEMKELVDGGYLHYDFPRFRALCEEMILNRLFVRPLTDPVVVEFSRAKREEQSALLRGSQEEQQAFWAAKTQWLELQEVLGELLLSQEQARLRNAHVRADFLKLFGKEYVGLQQAILELRTWERRLMTWQAHPDWDEAQVEQSLQEAERRSSEELERLQHDASLARAMEVTPSSGMADDGVIAAYLAKVKKTLREIYLLFHEDRLVHDPVYASLTAEQKATLDGLLKRALEIKADQELHHAKGTLGYENRSLAELLSILERGKTILANAGIDVRVEYVIQGETVAQKTEWLQREIERLRQDASRLRAQIVALNEDRETRERKLILDSEADHPRIREELGAKRREYESRAAAVRAQYERMGSPPC